MREELQGLQPQLEQTSRETVELIKDIELDTEKVAVVKKAVEADEAVANAAATDAKAIKVHTQLPPLQYYYVIAAFTPKWKCPITYTEQCALKLIPNLCSLSALDSIRFLS